MQKLNLKMWSSDKDFGHMSNAGINDDNSGIFSPFCTGGDKLLF
jgi:hypothetical protein